MGSITRDRNHYYVTIWKYKDRREGYKKKYGLHSPKYKMLSARISAKIGHLNHQLKRMDLRLSKERREIKLLDQKVTEFFGFSPLSIEDSSTLKLRRDIFFTWGMEKGIKGRSLSRYIGAKYLGMASEYRMAYKRSFTTNSINLDFWNRFKEFMRRDALQVG